MARSGRRRRRSYRDPLGRPLFLLAAARAIGAALALALIAGPLHAGAPEPEIVAAARAGDAAAVRALIEQGADPDAFDGRGRTALIHAAADDHGEIVQLLIAAGADVDAPDFEGFTALINAADHGHAEIVEQLIRAGADPTVVGPKSWTAAQHARHHRHHAIAKRLRKAEMSRTAVAVVPDLPTGAGARSSGAEDSAPAGAGASAEALYRPRYARRIGIVIGVNEYVHWPPLLGATGDAHRVAATLRKLGFEEILELYDASATRAGILNLLGARLERLAQPNDLVFVYFAGHGHTETLPGGEKRGYIVPVDASNEAVFSTAISMQALRSLSDRIPSKHVYFAMDSCYSGLGLRRGIGMIKNDPAYVDKLTSLRAVQMVTAGMEGEEALEVGGHGLFTSELIRALEGEADYDGDGWVTASEIGSFVLPKVTNVSKAKQTPQYGTLDGTGEVLFELPRHR